MRSAWLNYKSKGAKLLALYLSVIVAFVVLYAMMGINAVIIIVPLTILCFIWNMLNTRKKIGF